MPQTRVQAPDGTLIDFPAEMNDQQVTDAMQKLHMQHPEWGGFAANSTPGQPGAPGLAKPNTNVQPDTSGVARLAEAHPHVSTLMSDPLTPDPTNPTGPKMATSPDESGGLTARAVNDYRGFGRGFERMSDQVAEIPAAVQKVVPELPGQLSQLFSGKGKKTSMVDAYKTTAKAVGGGVASLVPPKVRPDEPWDERLSEAGGQLGFNIVLGKLMSSAFPEKPGAAAEPTEGQVRDVRRALRPKDRNLQFANNLRQSWDAVKQEIAKQRGQIPDSLNDWKTLLESAKSSLWQQYTDLLDRASTFKNKAKLALPAASTPIETGVQGVRGGTSGGVYPAASRDINVPGERVPGGAPTEITNAIQANNERSHIGSQAAAVPDRVFNPPSPVVDQTGTQAAAIPSSTLGSKTESGTQYLTGTEGGAGPESGKLKNPGQFSSRSPEQIRATRDRLAAVVNGPHFDTFEPAEQSAMRGQLERMNKLLEPSPQANVPYGPTIDGNHVANAIENTLNERTWLKNPGTARAIHDFAQTYRRAMTPQQAEEFLQGANKDAQPWYEAAKRDPDHAAPHHLAAVAEGNALRTELYKLLDKLNETNPGTAAKLKKTYGSLSALHEAVLARIPVWERQSPNLLGRQIHVPLAIGRAIWHASNPGSMFRSLLGSAAEVGAEEGMRVQNTPEAQMNRAFTSNSRPSIPRTIGKAVGQGVAVQSALGEPTHIHPQTGVKIKYDPARRAWINTDTGEVVPHGQ